MQSSSFEERYELRELLGSGGAGKVYKAWDRSLHRYVAVKRFGSEFGLATASDEQAWREAMTLASIQHPNILTVYDFGVDEQGPYVIMEYLEGETLDKVVAREPFHPKEFRELARQTLEALIAAHQIGLIHRDLKPQNIMAIKLASGATQYKILDFGLAKIIQEPRVQTMIGDHTIVGSIFYVAPEQLSRRPVDARSDLYSLGCVYYFALTGQNPFGGESVTEIITSHIRHRVVPLHQRRCDLPTALCDWVMKFINLQPEHRWQSASEALAALTKLPSAKTITLRTSPVSIPPESAPVSAATAQTRAVPAPKPSSFRVAPVVSTALLVVLVTVGILLRSVSGTKRRAPAAAKTGRTAEQRVSKVPTPTTDSRRSVQRSATPQSAQAPPKATLPVQREAEPVAGVQEKKKSLEEEFPITAPILWSHEIDRLKAFVGKEAAVKGRVSEVRSRGDELWIGLEGKSLEELAIVFPVDKNRRGELLTYARKQKQKMVCVQGAVEKKGDTWVIRGKDVRQLDVLPPL